PAHRGALRAYNQLIGDVDGRYGSGTSGWVVIDSSDPARGFKSFDWWGTIRATQQGWSKAHTAPTFSAAAWDRWVLRGLYATGGDGALFFDCTNQVRPFTVVVEDCVGIGRAFGGGVANCLSRSDEPIVFRRCRFWCLDWWGDAAGAYVRIENKTMPPRPDVLFEDCTLVGPDNALKSGNPGFRTYSRVKLKNCRLIALNFSQPRGKPSTGIIHSTIEGELFHVDLEDCTLMGYKVFGVGKGKQGKSTTPIRYTTRGSVNAYVQFQQQVPQGFHRLTHWPTDVFQSILPPRLPSRRPALKKEGLVRRDLCEIQPVIWKGRLCLLECIRPSGGGPAEKHYLVLRDAETNRQLARFAKGYGLASAIVHGGVFYAFASRFEANNGPWNDVTLFKSRDLVHWERKVVIRQKPHERIFNCSVCAGPDGFVMAYESSDRAFPAFTIKFARSKDLENWTLCPDALLGTNRYTACPCIRYADGYYYVLYTERRTPRWFFEVFIARSKDLRSWEQSPTNPVLTADCLDEGIDASDPDLIEWRNKTLVYYSVGDQRTWMNVKRASYAGTLQEFLASWFVEGGIPDPGTAPAAK
ncbi:MAG: hypothetical protein GXP27_15625, partial [Planctomycetes bacterium]|nr:hypothetical protein [Planctomycetota bacterium]